MQTLAESAARAPKTFVIDTSLAVKVLFEEDGSPLARLVTVGANRILAPDLLALEIGAVAIKKLRLRQIEAARSVAATQMIRDLPDLVVPSVALIEDAVALASKALVAVPDAIFAALAMREKLTLATADRRLEGALRGVAGAPPIWLLPMGQA
jgi:predicted nucleic acid-binding protein